MPVPLLEISTSVSVKNRKSERTRAHTPEPPHQTEIITAYIPCAQ